MLATLRTGKRILRRLFPWRQKTTVHYMHIGKTGGNAFKDAVKNHRHTRKYHLLLHTHNFVLNEVPPGEKVIFALRHPVSRFVSGFYSRQRMGKPRNNVPWTDAEAAAFAKFKTAQDLGLALSADDPARRAAAERAMGGIGHVRDSFYRWFDSEAYFLSRLDDILYIAFQETLGEDFENLKKRLGLPQHLTLPGDEVASHRNPDVVDTRLDDASRRNLLAWYADEVRFFELCRSKAADINQGSDLLSRG